MVEANAEGEQAALSNGIDSLSLTEAVPSNSTSNGLLPPSLATMKAYSTTSVPLCSDLPVSSTSSLPLAQEPQMPSSSQPDVASPLKSKDFALPSVAPAQPPPTASSSTDLPTNGSGVNTGPAAQSAAGSSLPPTTQRHSSAPANVPSISTSATKTPIPAGSNMMPRGLGGLRGRGGASGSTRNIPVPPSLQAKVAALANRSRPSATSSASTSAIPTSSASNSSTTHLASSDRIDASRFLGPSSSASIPQRQQPLPNNGGAGAPGIMGRRKGVPGLSLAGMAPEASGSGGPSATGAAGRRKPPGLSLAGMNGGQGAGAGAPGQGGTPFANFNKIVDPSGRLNFGGKAVLHAKGVDFSNGSSFAINMDDLTLMEELGHGNYGTVQKVFHKKTKVTMAMKEIRLELDESKLKGIITELDILHRAVAPEIVEFYGAFFIESCVYYCMEFMDAGSLEKLAGYEVPEDVLARVTACTVRGLRFLKDELQTMHRDVKPTNILINRAGSVKLCDFGVSAQLERSLAKTNIGCQSYMAPERIKGESQGNVSSYTVSSDVWSLGVSMIEFAVGHYPYPPETYANVFAQLQAIVHGDPPSLPSLYSSTADEFIAACLRKDAYRRPTYAQLMEHPFLKEDSTRQVDMAGWVSAALDFKAARKAAEASPVSSSSSTSPAPSPSTPAQ